MPLLPLALCSCRFRPNYQHKTQLDLPTPHGGIQRALRVSVQPLGDSVATDNSATDILPPSQSQILQQAFERIFKASTLTFNTTMYKFTITDVQMLKSNGNEEFASLIEIMIQDEHACISGDLGIEIQSAVDAAKAAEAAAAAAATEISLENVVEMLNVYRRQRVRRRGAQSPLLD